MECNDPKVNLCIIYFLLIFFRSFTVGGKKFDDDILFECDHIFDSIRSEGEFKLPILPFSENEVAPMPTKNMQCIYTFVAGPKQRVKLTFEQFQLDGTAKSCENEYIDLYSELENPDDDLLSSALGGRYCGTVSPYVRISLHRVIVLVFHSRVGAKRRTELKLQGKYFFISDAQYIVGHQISSDQCAFLIDSTQRLEGTIYSPTYPGTYPKNFNCTYLLKGKSGQRIRLYFRDFDIYFGGEHCPYDSLTVYDGSSSKDAIIRKICGLQQRLEIYTLGPNAFIEFVSSISTKADPRGYLIDYEFSFRYVDVLELLGNQRGVTHLRGSECDIRVESNRETIHHIQSPKYPNIYPANATCTYIIDGLQGEQNLEKVILTFETFAVLSEIIMSTTTTTTRHNVDYDDDICATTYVGIATRYVTIKSVLASGEESSYDATLCERFNDGSYMLGPYISEGPRMVLVFSSYDRVTPDGIAPYGFRAKIEFRTDFGIPGEPVGDSNRCAFKFTKPQGFFNSPRYPANYPTDTNCTYNIIASPGQQIQVYFEQFALYSSEGSSFDDKCSDFLEIFDVFERNGSKVSHLQARYCSHTFPGPTVSAFGSNEMRVFFRSDSEGTGNGFKALYRIRRAFEEEIPTRETTRHCGRRITATDYTTSGSLTSPGFPIKYNKDLICDWEIVVKEGHQILLTLVSMDVEGAMNGDTINCQNAVIRVDADQATGSGANVREICGTVESVVQPIISKRNVVRISFLTSPDKVNGLKGFNFTWTQIKIAKDDEECLGPSLYLCTYTKLCIDSRLRCDGDDNCGLHDDTDEAYCNKLESATDFRTILFAAAFSGCIFLFICVFFCYLFKKKFEKKVKKRRRYVSSGLKHLREPYRSQKPVMKVTAKQSATHALPSPAASRLTNYDLTRISSIQEKKRMIHQHHRDHQDIASKTFYG